MKLALVQAQGVADKMKIAELQPGQGSVNIQVTVKSMDEPKTINKYGRELKLRNILVTDGESEIKLTLWNEDINKVKQGAILKIENGYVNEFQGEKQLTTGKFGKLEIVEGEAEVKEEIKEEKIELKKSQKEPSGSEEKEEIEDY